MEQFIGMNLGEDSFIINETIDGLAGSTITSTAVTEAVANASELWVQYLGDGIPEPSQGDSGRYKYLESIYEFQSKSVEEGAGL
jgi:hypothetical protein